MGKGVTPAQFNRGSSTRSTQETNTLKEQVRDEVCEEFCEKMDEMEAKVSQSQAQVEILLSLLDPFALRAFHAASSARGKSSHVDLSDGQAKCKLMEKANDSEVTDEVKDQVF